MGAWVYNSCHVGPRCLSSWALASVHHHTYLLQLLLILEEFLHLLVKEIQLLGCEWMTVFSL